MVEDVAVGRLREDTTYLQAVGWADHRVPRSGLRTAICLSFEAKHRLAQSIRNLWMISST